MKYCQIQRDYSNDMKPTERQRRWRWRMLATTLRCLWCRLRHQHPLYFNISVGHQHSKDVTNIKIALRWQWCWNLSPISRTLNQQISSLTSVTNIVVFRKHLFSNLKNKIPWKARQPREAGQHLDISEDWERSIIKKSLINLDFKLSRVCLMRKIKITRKE